MAQPTYTYAVFGLGNPGKRYAHTRHNAGAMVVDILARRHGIRLWRRRFQAVCGKGAMEGREVWLIKPQTYMNLSGVSVSDALRRIKIDPARCLVITDDINLPVGALRLRARGSAGGHKGLASIIEEIQMQDFPRLRLGVGSPPPGVDAADYVLAEFKSSEVKNRDECLARAADAVALWLRVGTEKTMASFND